ncbi:unnamed protein product [Clavelina lepadiformis]|uniref:V-SNARE coiled-coil homology domain-containing protein n=1 Tax=Clavelina lepadiformis TaxID=159417 RepID=A0ABP0F8D1_CLALP
MASYGKSKPKGSSERVALLDDYESDDDDFFLNGPSTASDKVKRVQNQVNEVVGVMQTNIGKVMDRGERLEDLQVSVLLKRPFPVESISIAFNCFA